MPTYLLRWLWSGFALPALALLLTACGSDDPPTQPPSDTLRPVVRIEYPVDSLPPSGIPATAYDETANGLIDVRATWSDADSGVDPSTLRIQVLGQIAGSAGSGDDLSGLWQQIELTDTGMTFEETIEQLVRQGSSRLIVSVEDSAGNRGADTLEIHPRYGDFHLSIPLQTGAITTDLMVCEDDERLYVARGFAITVFDANTFQLIGTFSTVLSLPPAAILCVPGDPILYAAVRVNRFNRTTLEWDTVIPGSLRTTSLVQSREDTDIIWAGEFGFGIPGRYDRIAGIPANPPGDTLFPPSSVSDEFVFGLAVLDQDRKIYYSRAREGGIVVGDPATGEQLTHIDLQPDFAGRGLTDNMVLSPDDRFVYAALQGTLNGLVEISTVTDRVTRDVVSIGGFGIDVAIRPAGDRIWLTTQDLDPADPSPSLLIDAGNFVTMQFFPRPVAPGVQTRWVQAATFHPNGKLLYQGRDDDIDVYLIR